jgi:hypothetical protein
MNHPRLGREIPMKQPRASLRSIAQARRSGVCRTSARIAAALAFLISLTALARGDDFGRLDGAAFFELPRRADARSHTSISIRDLEGLPTVLQGERAALLVARTDEGNLAKMLVSSGLRKLRPSEKDSALVPVLLLERYETIDAGDRRSFKARGKDVMLFDGFQFDLDAGQVVPAGSGGDIEFSSRAPDGPRLLAVGQNRLYTLEKPVQPPSPAPGRPSSGRVVQPADFGGRYQLLANGRWSGTLELAIDAQGAVSGRFRSDSNGSVYPVTGKVAQDIPQKIGFSIQYPRARQTYEGLLWTEGKNAIAGTLSMLDHPYSFVAIREGASLAPDAFDLRSSSATQSKASPLVIVLEAGSDRCTIDGAAKSAAEMAETLTKAVKNDPATAVLLRVPETVPFERVRRVAAAIQSTGVSSIRAAPAGEKAEPR